MTAVITEGSCPWCSREGLTIWHSGGCPRVKAIEYHPSGAVKRVEFHEERPAVPRGIINSGHPELADTNNSHIVERWPYFDELDKIAREKRGEPKRERPALPPAGAET